MNQASSQAPQRFEMHKTRVGMDDGRVLNYYDFAPQNAAPPYLTLHQEAVAQHPPASQRVLEHSSEMRWNPTLGEWTVYAPHRMNRVQLPSANACPLCPGILELPLPYQVAIFENRSPGLSFVPGDTSLPIPQGIETQAVGRGRCDIVVYSQKHSSKMAEMSVEEIHCLIEAWRDRYGELMALPEVVATAIFENKGREAGMTLDHPHGQIYALPFLPPALQAHWNQTVGFLGEDGLWEQIIAKEVREGSRIVAQSDGFVAAQPFYARYPYEVHIWARRKGVSSLLEMSGDERAQLASMMKNIVSRYENLWPDAAYGFPTLMCMQQISGLEGAEKFRFHVEFYPLQRSAEKLKYRASMESGYGTFLNDALPETQAAELKNAAPQQLEISAISFAD